MPKQINEYRLVDASSYPKNTHPSAMNAHYPHAKTLAEAFNKVPTATHGVLWKSWDSKGSPIPVSLPKGWDQNSIKPLTN